MAARARPADLNSMKQLRSLPAWSRVPTRLALLGMSLAVLALGALAVWSAVVTHDGAQGLSRAGVQTTGHLRAVQALSLIDTETDRLEDGFSRSGVRTVRRAQLLLDDALGRMARGGVPEASR